MDVFQYQLGILNLRRIDFDREMESEFSYFYTNTDIHESVGYKSITSVSRNDYRLRAIKTLG